MSGERGRKTLRNLLLCLLLWLAVYAMLGFPPYTVEGMLDRAERRYLLSNLEPVLVKRSERRYSNELFSWHTTYLLARSGDTYLWTNFDRHLLEVSQENWMASPKLCRGALCTALDGTLYIAGPFEDAVSARIEVTTEKVTQVFDPDTEEYQITLKEGRTFTYEGEKVSDALFSCRYRQGERIFWLDDRIPEKDYDLAAAAHNWYRCYTKGDGDGSSWVHAELPVKVTLYGGDGRVLDVLELSMDTYELDDRF